MSRTPLREWFERHLDPGDLEHKRQYVGLYLTDESKAVRDRINGATAELRRRCKAGTVKIWARMPGPNGLGELKEFTLPIAEWSRVVFVPKVGRLKYPTVEYVGVEMDDGVTAARGRGRPSRRQEIKQVCHKLTE